MTILSGGNMALGLWGLRPKKLFSMMDSYSLGKNFN